MLCICAPPGLEEFFMAVGVPAGSRIAPAPPKPTKEQEAAYLKSVAPDGEVSHGNICALIYRAKDYPCDNETYRASGVLNGHCSRYWNEHWYRSSNCDHLGACWTHGIRGYAKPIAGDELREITSKEKLPINIVQLDIDSDNSVADAFKQILREKGQIDVLVNNAGIIGRGYIEEAPIAVFRQVMETNFFGGLRCIQAVLPSMRERKNGCIINITSVAGQFGLSPQGAYAASKWAFEGLSECLAQELSPFNVRVAIVEPGVIRPR